MSPAHSCRSSTDGRCEVEDQGRMAAPLSPSPLTEIDPLRANSSLRSPAVG